MASSASRSRKQDDLWDVLILGGGPAGMSALLWCNSLGLHALLLEQERELGGQLLEIHHPITDYPGLLPKSGARLRDAIQAQLKKLKLSFKCRGRLERILPEERALIWSGKKFRAQALIIATGARQRSLELPGEEHFFKIGDVRSHATRDQDLYRGKMVCVVGGGDSAIENAIILSKVAKQVTLIHRSERFRARVEWQNQARDRMNLIWRASSQVIELKGSKRLNAVVIKHLNTGEVEEIPSDGIFVNVGIAPNTEEFRGLIELSESGYIEVDSNQRTSVPWIFAAGDVCHPLCLSAATAVGQGAIAAKGTATMARKDLNEF